jgi:hypothetical protein
MYDDVFDTITDGDINTVTGALEHAPFGGGIVMVLDHLDLKYTLKRLKACDVVAEVKPGGYQQGENFQLLQEYKQTL